MSRVRQENQIVSYGKTSGWRTNSFMSLIQIVLIDHYEVRRNLFLATNRRESYAEQNEFWTTSAWTDFTFSVEAEDQTRVCEARNPRRWGAHVSSRRWDVAGRPGRSSANASRRSDGQSAAQQQPKPRRRGTTRQKVSEPPRCRKLSSRPTPKNPAKREPEASGEIPTLRPFAVQLPGVLPDV